MLKKIVLLPTVLDDYLLANFFPENLRSALMKVNRGFQGMFLIPSIVLISVAHALSVSSNAINWFDIQTTAKSIR